MSDHKDCRETVRRGAADRGVEVHVSTAPPVVPSVYGANSFICPHGVEYFIEPTGDQIARWVKDGTP